MTKKDINSSKKQKLSTASYKGVRDFYPEDQAFFMYVANTCRKAVEKFGYVEYHASILEPSELYKSKGAENEEIINEQTYSFTDRGEREVTLRPEMTPTVARMVAGKRRELGFPLRLFSIPNLFRYERTQRGRLREHWQLNVDIFGSSSLGADSEILLVAHDVLRAFGAEDSDFVIKIGSRSYIEELAKKYDLSEDSKRAFITLLDRKNKMPKEEFDTKLQALAIPLEALSLDAIPSDITEVLDSLKSLGVTNAEFDPSIVRGFNYYTGLVFEVFDTHPDNNRALFGGGRYDNLLEMFDDEKVPGVGFGMGDVTIQDFLEVRGRKPEYVPPTLVYVAVTSPEIVPFAQTLAAELRQENVAVAMDFGEKKLAEQIKAALKHKIPYLLVLGDTEQDSNSFTVRELQTKKEEKLDRSELAEFFKHQNKHDA